MFTFNSVHHKSMRDKYTSDLGTQELRLTECWDCKFISHAGHEYLHFLHCQSSCPSQIWWGSLMGCPPIQTKIQQTLESDPVD